MNRQLTGPMDDLSLAIHIAPGTPSQRVARILRELAHQMEPTRPIDARELRRLADLLPVGQER